ncbi:Long chain acyl-CoA synthetase [Arachis hypogaea]|nr:Long chain acyl-CoA synthetase [Arachis hypogaea]
MAQKRFIVEVEKAKEAEGERPSRGPVYRSLFAKDGFPPPVPGLDNCWDIFRTSVQKYPKIQCLVTGKSWMGSPASTSGKHMKKYMIW